MTDQVTDELLSMVRGALGEGGRRNKRLVAQVVLARDRALFFWIGLEIYGKRFSHVADVCVKLAELGNATLAKVAMPERGTREKILGWEKAASLDAMFRVAVCLRAICEDPNAKRLFPNAYQTAFEICGEGLPANVIEPCLHVAHMDEITKVQRKLSEAGVKNIGSLRDFSIATLEHVDMTNYDEDCREHFLTWMGSVDPATKQQYRASETSVSEFMAGLARLAKATNVRIPSKDVLFTFSAKAGKANGKGTLGLSRKQGNLVPRFLRAES